MKKTHKKLYLNRESVRVLEEREVMQAAGGTGTSLSLFCKSVFFTCTPESNLTVAAPADDGAGTCC